MSIVKKADISLGSMETAVGTVFIFTLFFKGPTTAEAIAYMLTTKELKILNPDHREVFKVDKVSSKVGAVSLPIGEYSYMSLYARRESESTEVTERNLQEAPECYEAEMYFDFANSNDGIELKIIEIHIVPKPSVVI